MRRFLRALLILLRGWQWIPTPEWTEEDTKALSAFLASSTGRRLVGTLSNLSIERHRYASAKAQTGNVWWAGYASGFESAIAELQSLSAPVPTRGQHEDSDLDAIARLEQTASTADTWN